jgi:hypothetical protein
MVHRPWSYTLTLVIAEVGDVVGVEDTLLATRIAPVQR